MEGERDLDPSMAVQRFVPLPTYTPLPVDAFVQRTPAV